MEASWVNDQSTCQILLGEQTSQIQATAGTVLSLPCVFSSLQPCQVSLGIIYVGMDSRILIYALWLSMYGLTT
jgi:hypothetical protein